MDSRNGISAFLLLLFASFLGCASKGIEVSVNGLTPEITSLLVSASLRDHPSATVLQQVTGRLDSFWLRIPDGTDSLSLSVAGLSDSKCRLAQGTLQQNLPAGGPLEVDLATLTEVGCSILVETIGDGKGKVVSDPPAIDCPGRCSATFTPGTVVRLKAIPATDQFYFSGWSQACSGTGGCLITVSDGHTVVRAGFLPGKVCRGSFCWEAPLPQGNSLHGLWARSARDVWAVGWAGTVLRFFGEAWVPIQSGTSNDLESIWGREDRLWAVGSAGTIVFYDGTTFVKLQSPSSANLSAISGNATEVWIAGEAGTLLRGNGSTFTQIANVPNVALHGVYVGSQEVWAVGDGGTVLRYDGTSIRVIPTGTNLALTSVTERGNGEFTIVGEKGTFFRWNGTSLVKDDARTAADLRAVWGTKDGELWSAGSTGSLFRFDGKNWASYGSGTTAYLNALSGSGASEAWAAGDGGTLLRWNGVFWSPLSNPDLEPLVTIGSVDGSTLITVGVSGTVRQRIAGVWHRIATGPGFAVEDAWIGPGEVWAVGGSLLMQWATNPPETTPRWRAIPILPSYLRGAARRTYDPTGKTADMFAVGDGGILYSVSGPYTGLTIRGVAVSASDLRSISFVTASEGWVVGDAGAILHIVGATVTPVASGVSTRLLRVYGLSANDVWAVGERGVILHWNGVSWSSIESGTTETLNSVWASATKGVWVSGNSGTVLSFDGARFSEVASGTTTNFTSITGASDGSILVVGENGAILSKN